MGNTDMHNGRIVRACVALAAVLVALVLATASHAANEVALAGTGSESVGLLPGGVWSAFSIEPDRSLVSTSAADTAVSFDADWSRWRDSGGGVIEIVADAITSEGRAATVTLGDLDAPALTLAASGGGWVVLPAGAFPANELQPLAPPATTNGIRLTLRAFSGGGRLTVDTRTDGGAWVPRPDLELHSLNWVLPSHTPTAWNAAGVSLAGDGATLAKLHLRIFRDPTLTLIR